MGFRFWALLFMSIFAAALSAAPAAEVRCNRECLRGFISKYLDSMMSHDPSRLPHSANIHPGITWRIAAVDEDLGIVLMRLNFGETPSYAAGRSLVVWEEFKI